MTHDPRDPGVRVYTGQLFRVRQGHRVELRTEPPPPPPKRTRPLRAARMLAVAHELQRMLDDGTVETASDLADRLGLTRARITQLLDLTLLAPDIQEQVLTIETERGRDPVNEQQLRRIVRHTDWEEQRRAWAALQ